MKLYIFPVLSALLMVATAALVPQKQVIITYSQETPDSLLVEAKDAIKATGGVITHEYELIKGFAAKASSKALNTVNILLADFQPHIEEDSIVTANGS